MRNFWLKHKTVLIVLGSILTLIVMIAVSFKVSPWPRVLIVRYLTGQTANKIFESSAKYLPDNIRTIANIQYRQDDQDAFLDIFYPKSIELTDDKLPLVVWLHGGGWIVGDKKSTENYAKIIASKGYIVANLNYSLAPEKQYPSPVIQLNDALQFLTIKSDYHIDSKRIIIAGNSAGAHIAAQVATMITNPAYAQLMGMKPAILSIQLKGMILNNGVYSTSLPNYDSNSRAGRFLRSILWAYSGEKYFEQLEAFRTASVIDFVDKNFPPSFITAGNGDPLLEHSKDLAENLENLGVVVDKIFYPSDYDPALPHGYFLNLDTEEGQIALQETVKFLNKVTSN